MQRAGTQHRDAVGKENLQREEVLESSNTSPLAVASHRGSGEAELPVAPACQGSPRYIY